MPPRLRPVARFFLRLKTNILNRCEIDEEVKPLLCECVYLSFSPLRPFFVDVFPLRFVGFLIGRPELRCGSGAKVIVLEAIRRRNRRKAKRRWRNNGEQDRQVSENDLEIISVDNRNIDRLPVEHSDFVIRRLLRPSAVHYRISSVESQKWNESDGQRAAG